MKPLSNLINKTMIKCLHFPNTEKIACITPSFKKDDRQKKENYQPISVLNAFSKIFERFLLDQMVPYLENILSVFISAYRKHYSCQHILLRMIEMWRRCLDDNKMVGAILMDLSKAFGCLPHDLLIAKLDAYGFDKEALRLILSYLSGRKQCIKNGGCLSMLKLILNGVPQGSILGPILFNVFINDIFLLLTQNLHNFADDNTITEIEETVQELINLLQVKTEKAINWLDLNNMIANPDKFKAIILSKETLNTTDITFNFKGQNISAKEEVDLLGITIDNKLTFETHISSLCHKAAGQLNALKRLSYYIPIQTCKILVEAFIFSNFNYCPLVWYFSTAKQMNKIERIQERALRFINNDYHLDYSTLLSKNEHVTMEIK